MEQKDKKILLSLNLLEVNVWLESIAAPEWLPVSWKEIYTRPRTNKVFNKNNTKNAMIFNDIFIQ